MNAVVCDRCKKVCTGKELDAAKSIKKTKYRNPKDPVTNANANLKGDVWEWFHLCGLCDSAFSTWIHGDE